MEIGKRRIFVPNRKIWYNLYPMSDLHWESNSFDIRKFRMMIRRIERDPRALVLFLGDLIDAIPKRDIRYDGNRKLRRKFRNTEDNLWDFIRDDMAEELRPIKDKILGIMGGNHEAKLTREYQYDFTAAICKGRDKKKREMGLGVKNLGLSCYYGLHFELKGGAKRRVVIYAHHGAGSAATTGGAITKIKKKMAEFPDAHIYLMGHLHCRIIDIPDVILLNRRTTDIVASKRIVALTGTFKRSYALGETGYEESKMYPPSSIGGIKISIRPFYGSKKDRIKLRAREWD